VINSSNKDKHIAVLLGGWNSERDVSRASGDAVYDALNSMGYKATKLEFDRNVVEKLGKLKPDIVFNALHGKFGEDGKIQGLLDIINIPYTHSGLLQSAICMNKILFRKICQSYDLISPQFDILKKAESANNLKVINKIRKPFVIKPIDEGSSIGIEVILDNMDFDIDEYQWKYGDEVIIEKYIKGKELQVAVIDNKAIGAVEIRPKNRLFYDYDSKYTAGMTDYIIPPQIDKEKHRELLGLALKCHKVVGCEDISRVDFLLDETDGKIYLLEINTHPGFTPLSLVPKIAKHEGISFEEIVEYLINNASCSK
jgi:D-alanine-D-alanine ligase